MKFTLTVPALPVADTAIAAEFYRNRLGFTVRHSEPGFAIVHRDEAELHLWQADDVTWRSRRDLAERPVVTGAESFLAGTASCRISVDDVDTLHDEMRAANVLHYRDSGHPVDTAWGTREFAITDRDNNQISFVGPPHPAKAPS